MSTRLQLTEYVPKSDVELTLEQRDRLRQVFPDVSITPTPGRDHAYTLTAGSHVGIAEFSDWIIEVRPKISFDRLFFVLSYALDPSFWASATVVPQEDAESLVEAVLPTFIHHVRQAFARGVLQGYREIEDSAMTIRGRIRFDEQIRRRQGALLPIEVRFDEFTEDIIENRLIKSAIGRLRRLTLRSERSRVALREFDTALELVSEQYFDSRHVPVVPFTHVNHRYQRAVELARLILRSSSVEMGSGRRPAVTFVVDMNSAFEDFVVVALREALGLSSRAFPQTAQGYGLTLDLAGSIGLEPDFSWWEGNRCVFVGDAKYKRLSVAGFKHPDIYQMLAYLVATGLASGLLIYAAGIEPEVSHVLRDGRRVAVASLDLRASPADLIAQIRRIAGEILRLRAHGMRLAS